MGWEVGGRFRRQETYVYLWLVHVDVWQRPAQHCKAIILQLKINKCFKKPNVQRGEVTCPRSRSGKRSQDVTQTLNPEPPPCPLSNGLPSTHLEAPNSSSVTCITRDLKTTRETEFPENRGRICQESSQPPNV